ncbi:hypothetical protein ACEWY4_013285 [Coilia grayii]|uniref:G-protein coupled receptors family 1 profile domain-containing protein n=1 Tax=Coilia grayii TaxID=363190 RepID=A0ABD1JVY4_9TELE
MAYITGNRTLCEYEVWAPSHILIPVLHVIICILGLSGNGIVIFFLWRSRSKWRAVDIYIGNLALADFIFLLNLPLWATYEALEYHWIFGRALCKLSNFLWLVNMYASIFFLTCLSLHRYLAIVHPQDSSRLLTRSHVHISLAFIWPLAGLLSVPELVFNNTFEKDNRTECSMDFSVVTGEASKLRWDASLDIMNLTLGFALPLLAVIVCYSGIAFTLARHFHVEHRDDERMWRLLKIISLLVLVFSVCWMPYHVVTIVYSLSKLGPVPPSCGILFFHDLVYPYVECLAYANSCLNPFLYAFCDPRFRLKCLHLLHLKSDPPSGSTS